MKTRVKLIPLVLAKSGMLLAESVLDDRGRVLLMSDTELTDTILAGLQRRRVSCVSVFEQDNRTEPQLQVLRDEVNARLASLFANVTPSSELGALHRYVLDYRLEPLL